jgi:DNA-binding transcriptional LysR family regulator
VIEWDDLRYFLAVWRSGTMSGAAQVLKVNQTTVGRRIGALEEQLGVLLFDRTPGGLNVTEAGRKIVEIASQMEESALSLERMVAGSDDRLEGSVRIACSETLAVGFLVEGLAAFRRVQPSIALEIITGNPPINLLRREADLAIRAIRPQHSELIVRKLVDVEWCLYDTTDAAAGAPDQPFEGRDVVGFDAELASVPAALWLHQRVAPDRFAVRCNTILAAAAAIRGGQGVGALPRFIGDRDPRLRQFLPEVLSTQPLWLAVHPDLQAQARVRAAIEHIVDLFCKKADWFRDAPRAA